MNIASKLVGPRRLLCARRGLCLSTIERLAIYSPAIPRQFHAHGSGMFATDYSIMNRSLHPLSQGLSQVSPIHSTAIPLQNSKYDPDSKFKLTLETVNESLRKMEYAVRGKIVMEAKQIVKNIQNVML